MAVQNGMSTVSFMNVNSNKSVFFRYFIHFLAEL